MHDVRLSVSWPWALLYRRIHRSLAADDRCGAPRRRGTNHFQTGDIMLRQENYQTMQIERRDHGIAIVTLNRPERLNAVNGRMHAELATFSRDFANDRDLRVLILTGAGR